MGLMRVCCYWLLAAVCPLLAWGGSQLPVAKEAERHRSPIDLAVLPGGQRVVVANHTADTVALVDVVANRVVAKVACGKKPAGIACSRDGKQVVVSNLWSDTVTLLHVQGDRLNRVREIAVGHMPRGLVFAPDGKTFYVALAGDHAVAQVDGERGVVLQTWPAPREPRRVVLSADGRYLVASSSRSAQVRCWDTRSQRLIWERTLYNAFNLLGLSLDAQGKNVLTAQIHHRNHPIIKENIEQGWALDNRIGRLALEPDRDTPPYWQIALDIRRLAVADPSAIVESPRSEWTVVAAPGTQELVLIQSPAIPWTSGEAGDFLDSSLDQEDGKFRRVDVGGRPLALQFLDDHRVAVANYLSDSLQVVDVKQGKLTASIHLGGPAKPSLARRGEAIFYDGKRSHHQWFSCHSCHTDGHTSGRLFDTLNDEATGTPKMSPSLRGVVHTAPWTWHGWQNSLEASVEKSLTQTLWGPKPTAEEVKAVVAFLGTLEHPRNPRADKLSPAAQRGKALFEGQARCIRCHEGDYFTSTRNFDVKLPHDGSIYDKWNPPSLRGVADRGPYLHDGSVETLDELLRRPHAPEKLGAKPLTPEQRKDLIEYLRTL
jgi:YVTN family beta-propeller protein